MRMFGEVLNQSNPNQSNRVVRSGTAFILALGGGSLLLTGCSSGPEVTHGIVVSKEDIPARNWTYMMPVPHERCSSYFNGKNTVTSCNTYYTYIPIPEHDPEHWTLTLQDCSQRVDNNECATGTVDVSELVYQEAQLGDQYGQASASPR